METKAIPLVSFERGEFQVTPESLEFLRSITGKIAVIAVVGKYRTGKSFLLNRIILENKGTDGFGVGPTINPCTKGLWIWSEGIRTDIDGEKVTVLIIDSEGLGAFDEDANHDTRIFLLALLLSSYFIYNSVGSIDETALQNLSLIVNLSKQIQVKSNQSSLEEIGEYFPSFLWVLRDFSLKLIDSQGNTISTKDYLENALMPTKGVSDSVEAKNRIRRLLTNFFKERDCFALIRPTESERALQNLDRAEESVFRPEFLEMASKLRRHIFRKVKVKALNKSALTGEMLGNLAVSYVETINKGGVPNIEGAWTSVCQAECHKVIDVLLGEVDMAARVLKFPVAEEDFKRHFKAACVEAAQKFKEKAIGESTEKYIEILKEKINERKKIYQAKNFRLFEEKAQKETQEWFSGIQDQVRTGNLTTMQEFKSAKDSLLKTLEKALPQAVKEKVLQEVLNFQQEIAETLIRNQVTEQQNEIRKVNSQLEVLNDQLQRKKSEFEKEKDYFRGRVDELEKESSNYRGNNAVLTAKNEELMKQKKKIEESAEEKVGKLKDKHNEKINELKEKIAKASSKMNDLEANHSKCMAESQKEILLLKQELEFKTTETKELKLRNAEVEKLLKSSKKGRSGYEEVERREENSDWMSEKNLLKSQIESLKSHLEDNKSIQEALMAALNSKNSDTPHHIDKAYETNKHLSFALDKSEENCKKLEQKLQKSKKFQKMVKNCISLQCKQCLKNNSTQSFLQHVSNCEGSFKESSTLILSISKAVIKETEGKPTTEYSISVSFNSKISIVLRKYKMFCNLHSSLKNLFPHFDLPDLFASIEMNGRAKSMEERRKSFENYLVQLSQISFIKESSVFRRFIGLECEASANNESPIRTKRMKSSIDTLSSRAFSPLMNVLSPLNS